MSVPKSQRSEAKLRVHVEIRRLVNHTLVKTGNSNKFGSRERYELEWEDGRLVGIDVQRAISRSELARRINDAAIGAGELAWRANDVRVGPNGERYAERRALQDKSVERLDSLLYLIDQARVTCGLSGREAKHWSDMTRDARNLVRKWRDADARRYSRLG